MRLLVPLLALGLTLGCGPKVDHPDAAPDCDPATMDCGGYKPPAAGDSGVVIGSGSGGEGPTPTEGATVAGDVLVFTDDFFDQGLPFAGEADISATGESGSRVEGHYDGASFELMGVLKDPTNWFMVVPEEGSGMLTTITPIDTRILSADGISLGLASEAVVDGMFVLVGLERAPDLAQLVVKVVDEQGRSVAGVTGSLTAEVVAHRQAGGWIIGDAETDDSGMIFFGNVPAAPTLATESIQLSGAVTARVEAQSLAGATTIVTAVVSAP